MSEKAMIGWRKKRHHLDEEYDPRERELLAEPTFLDFIGNEVSEFAVVKTPVLRVRQYPHDDAVVICELESGSRVQILSREGDWTRIKTTYPKMYEGYVLNRYLEPSF